MESVHQTSQLFSQTFLITAAIVLVVRGQALHILQRLERSLDQPINIVYS